MSSLWTPSGEHFPKKEADDAAAPPSGPEGASDVAGSSRRGAHARADDPLGGDEVGADEAGGGGFDPGADYGLDPEAAPQSEAEAQAAVDAMRAQLANTPAEIVLANHCYGLFELAAIYLSQTPPMLFQARLAIDGLGALLEGLKGRLGETEPSLFESLSQLRLAFVRLDGTDRSSAENSANVGETPG
jgi:hypothetical protein